MKKTISALLTVAILLFSVSSVFAAIDIIEDSGYAIVDPSTVPGASVYENLVPNVSVTPTPMTSKEELKSYTSSLFSNQFGNYDFYKIDVTVSNLGELVNGKDENESPVYVGIYDIKVFLPGVTSFPKMNWKNNQISGNTMNFVANTAGTGMNFKWTAPSLSNPYPLFDSSADPFVSQYIADASLSWYVVVGIETGSTLTISDIDTTITYTHSIDKKNPENNKAAKQSVTLAPAAPATVDVTSVTISGATAATVGDDVQLSATVLPDNATDPTVTWTKVSGDGAVSASGVVTATAAGDVVVKATAGGVDSANYTVSFAAPAPTPVYTDSSIDVKKPVSGTSGLTDLQGNEVTLTANYGIAKFSKAIDTVANNYFVVATDSNDVEKEFEVDFAANGVEISNASTTFFAIVKSEKHTIKSIRLKEIAK